MTDKTYRIIQANLNHCLMAQNLLFQHMVEFNAGLAIVSEPAGSLNDNWLASKDKKSAIYWNNDRLGYTCKLVHQGTNFVAVKVGKECVISCYISPNVDLGTFQQFLDELSDVIHTWGTMQVIVAGDFNAASLLWDSHRSNQRGERLINWAAETDLRLLNDVGVCTCIRPQGRSTIDLTWVSSDMLIRLADWQVLDTETLSDHRHIIVTVHCNANYSHKKHANKDNLQTKWRLDKCNWDTFVETSGWLAECGPSQELEGNIDSQVEWIETIMTSACDLSAPRVKRGNKNRKSMYWWSTNISDLREICIKARRKWTRARGKKPPPELNRLQAEYKLARKNLRDAIRTAKRNAWQELLDVLDRDPWGLGYKIIVVGALRGPSSRLTETLDEAEELAPLLDRLFPTGNQPPQLEISFNAEEQITDAEYVTKAEILQVLKRSKVKKSCAWSQRTY